MKKKLVATILSMAMFTMSGAAFAAAPDRAPHSSGGGHPPHNAPHRAAAPRHGGGDPRRGGQPWHYGRAPRHANPAPRPSAPAPLHVSEPRPEPPQPNYIPRQAYDSYSDGDYTVSSQDGFVSAVNSVVTVFNALDSIFGRGQSYANSNFAQDSQEIEANGN